jgi:ribonuclease VapC
MASLIDGLGPNVIALTQASAQRVVQAYARWGKGIHPAGLNLADCFAYDVAKEHACALLYVGNDFARTDIKTAT